MVKNENLPLFRLPQLRRIVSKHFLTSGIVYPLTVEAADADISICFFLQKNVPKGRTERAQDLQKRLTTSRTRIPTAMSTARSLVCNRTWACPPAVGHAGLQRVRTYRRAPRPLSSAPPCNFAALHRMRASRPPEGPASHSRPADCLPSIVGCCNEETRVLFQPGNVHSTSANE